MPSRPSKNYKIHRCNGKSLEKDTVGHSSVFVESSGLRNGFYYVAQTRAKHACMLVGDSATLSSDPYLGWLLEHAQEMEAYDSAWSWMC